MLERRVINPEAVPVLESMFFSGSAAFSFLAVHFAGLGVDAAFSILAGQLSMIFGASLLPYPILTRITLERESGKTYAAAELARVLLNKSVLFITVVQLILMAGWCALLSGLYRFNSTAFMPMGFAVVGRITGVTIALTARKRMAIALLIVSIFLFAILCDRLVPVPGE